MCYNILGGNNMEKRKELSPWEKIIMQRIRSLITDYCDGSQQRFADRTGINKGSVSQYVNGKNTPSHENAEKIASAFNVDVTWVLALDAIPDGITLSEQKKGNELLNLYENADPDVQKAVMLLLKSAQHKP